MSDRRIQEFDILEEKAQKIIKDAAQKLSMDEEIELDLSELPILFMTKVIETLRDMGYEIRHGFHPLYQSKITVRRSDAK